MKHTYPSLSDVRERLKIDWYRSPIPRDRLKQLVARNDIHGLLHAIAHLALAFVTGSVTVWLFDQSLWGYALLSLWVHGLIYSFIPGHVPHELSHGTVFKTKWLNGFLLRFFSVLTWFNFHHYKKSHTLHHMYTLFPEGDREVELPTDPSLRILGYVRLITFDWLAAGRVIWGTAALALTGTFRGHFKPEWSEAIFADGNAEEKRKAQRLAMVTLLFHGSIVALGVVTGLWSLPIVVSLGSFVAGWWKHLVAFTMHAGLRDNVADFRKCCRTVKLDPISRFLYWNMNYHTEHHMYAAVPFYRLPQLSKEIAWDMPKPRSVRQAWREMLDTFERQKSDPSYQFDTPVPNQGGAADQA